MTGVAGGFFIEEFMYRITPRHDEKDMLATTATLDAGIVAVREQSKIHGRAVLRDGGRIRIVATHGKAVWTRECPKCKGSGCLGDKPCHCVGTPVGRGLVEDLPC